MLSMLILETRFRNLAAAHFASNLAEFAYELIFVLLVLEVTNGNVLNASLIYFVRFLPYPFLGILGGTLADRHRPKHLMLFSDIGRLISIAALTLVVANNQITPLNLALLGMAMTAFKTVFQPSFQVLLPALVSKKGLLPANSFTQLSIELASVIGPAIGALILHLSGKQIVLAISSLIFFIAIWIIYFVDDQWKVNEKKILPCFSIRSIFYEMRDVASTAFRHPKLFEAIFLSSVCIFFVASVLRILLPAFVLDHANGNESAVAWSMCAIAAGTMLGATIFPFIIGKKVNIKIIHFWCIYGVCLFILPLITEFSLFLVGAFILGLIGAFVDISIVSTIQRYSHTNKLGQNFGLFSTLANTSESFSALGAGFIASITSASAGIGIAGLCVIALCAKGTYCVIRKGKKGNIK